ncbi:hypothetical protein DFH27DRAFT_220860 [Peziza echinospora]|nr:hypothetical protein DFH27DRAFT_220860 [Peziza echinospora]
MREAAPVSQYFLAFTVATSALDALLTSSSPENIPAFSRSRRPGSRMATTLTSPSLLSPHSHGLRGLWIVSLVILSLFTTQTSAALVTFTNCLPDDVQRSPTHLQFTPLAVNAKFDLKSVPYVLNVTVYGNVTGTSSANPSGKTSTRRRWLEDGPGVVDDSQMAGGRHWREREEEFSIENFLVYGSNVDEFSHGGLSRRDNIAYNTTGKIVDVDPAWPNFQTTLRSRIDVLTFRLYDKPIAFCAAANSCPMGTTYMPSGGSLLHPEFLPSFTLSTNLRETYSFTSIISTFQIIAGDEPPTHIGCIRVEVTPPLGNAVSDTVRWTPAAILIFVGLATISAAIFNPWNGTKDIFRWTSNYGMDDDMLRLVTPGFGDCLQYLQFVVLTGSLSLAYPGFFQPVLSNAAWSVLLFNSTTTSEEPMVDSLYTVDAKYGLERMARYVGIGKQKDIWAVTMAYFSGLLLGMVILIQLGFLIRWGFMKVKSIAEEDLRAKNRPFTLGNIIRFMFNYLLNPFVTFNTFQFILHNKTPDWYTGLAATFFTLFVLMTVFMLYQIAIHKPRAALCDDLQTLLQYGPIYNTYRLESNPFFCTMQVSINILRAIAFGGVQKSGIAQLTLLAICEILLILVINAVRPYSSKTSMNLYQTFFSAMRLLTVVLLMAFIPQLKIEDSAKGWVGYAVLLCHAIVLVFGFFLNALQTLAEIIARLMGAGNDGGTAARGGLAQVFGKRQLSRRSNRFETQHRSLHLRNDSSGTPSLLANAEGERKSVMSGSARPGMGMIGRSQSTTNSSGMMFKRNDQGTGAIPDSSALVGLLDPNSPSTPHGHQRASSTSTAFTPTSPIASSYPQAGGQGGGGGGGGGGAIMGLGVLANSGPDPGPFYRPPRTRTNTIGLAESPHMQQRGSWSEGDWSPRYDAAGNLINPQNAGPRAPFAYGDNQSQRSGSRGAPYAEDWEATSAINANNQNSGAATPPQFVGFPSPGSVRHQPTDSTLGGSARANTDYAVREMDFYYGVQRGPALSSSAPSRRLGTGPADPTSPMAVAKGWLVNRFGRRKEKAKGFEVVRSSRAPQVLKEMQEAEAARRGQMNAAGAAITTGDESSDDENAGGGEPRAGKQKVKSTTDTDDDSGTDGEERDNYGEGPSNSAVQDRSAALMALEGDVATSLPSRTFSKRSLQPPSGVPTVPRKSSKRKSSNPISETRSLSPTPINLRHSIDAGATSPTPTQGYELYDPPSPSNAHLRNIQAQASPTQLHSTSSTRLPFQTSPMQSRHSRGEQGMTADGVDPSPGNSRNSSNASSILPPVPGFYGAVNRDGSGSLMGDQLRPASVGTVSRHRMEDSLTEVTDQRALVAGYGSTAEVVDRSNSMVSDDGDIETIRITNTEAPGTVEARRRYSFD